MKQQKCLPLPTDLSLVDFIKGYVCWAHITMTQLLSFFSKGILLFNFGKLFQQKNFPNSHVLSVSLVCPVKGLKMLQPSALAAAWPAIWLTYGLPSLLPVSFCSLMWDSPAGAHGEDQNQLGSDLSKGTLIQVIK